MYEIEFYEKKTVNLTSGIFLKNCEKNRKKARTQESNITQLMLHIQLLQNNGTRLPNNITKHIEEDIWELRPGNNRVFYFYYCNDTFVLLHHSERKHKRHRSVKLKKQNQNVTIIYPERGHDL